MTLNLNMNFYVNRYIGAFSYFLGGSDSNELMTDSGHISASITTTEYMLNNLNIFWGVGLNQQIKWTLRAQPVVIVYMMFIRMFGLNMVFI